jgi:hypothetical protein
LQLDPRFRRSGNAVPRATCEVIRSNVEANSVVGYSLEFEGRH